MPSRQWHKNKPSTCVNICCVACIVLLHVTCGFHAGITGNIATDSHRSPCFAVSFSVVLFAGLAPPGNKEHTKRCAAFSSRTRYLIVNSHEYHDLLLCRSLAVVNLVLILILSNATHLAWVPPPYSSQHALAGIADEHNTAVSSGSITSLAAAFCAESTP